MFEAAVGLVVLLAIIHGAWRGFVRQAATLSFVVAALALGYPLSRDLAPLVDLRAPFNRMMAFALVALIMSLILFLSASGLRKLLVRFHLKTWDGIAGALLGAGKGFILATLVTLAVLARREDWRPAVRESAVAKLMSRSLAVIHPLWPPEVRPALHPYVHYLDSSGVTAIRN